MEFKSKTKTIMHVILSLQIGGMEQVVHDLVMNLDRRRFNPVIVCVETVGHIGEELKRIGITVVNLCRMRKPVVVTNVGEMVKLWRMESMVFWYRRANPNAWPEPSSTF